MNAFPSRLLSMDSSAVPLKSGTTQRSPRIVARRQRVREELIRTGSRLIAARGLAQVSVADILAEVGTSRRTFYGYFANKYELVASVLNPVFVAGAERLTDTSRQPPASSVLGIVDCYVALWNSHRDALNIIAALEPAVMPYIEEGHKQFGAALTKVLKRAEKAGVLRNGDAGYTFKVITRTAVPLLKIYADHPDSMKLYRESMLALLSKDRSIDDE
jgi:AcrR family transcriptional regulator